MNVSLDWEALFIACGVLLLIWFVYALYKGRETLRMAFKGGMGAGNEIRRSIDKRFSKQKPLSRVRK
jgi:hypothetical protein